jgi:2-oxoglutarate dehydrogenase E2 component (dihydrolipoamide succinyltransferase)
MSPLVLTSSDWNLVMHQKKVRGKNIDRV